MATTTRTRRAVADAAGGCPRCGSGRLPDADGEPTCPVCPLPIMTDEGRLALYRRATRSPALDTFAAMTAAVRQLAEMAERFETEATTPGTALADWFNEDEDADTLAADLRAAVRFVGYHLEVVGSVLPARA